jgi:hypothetical protein
MLSHHRSCSTGENYETARTGRLEAQILTPILSRSAALAAVAYGPSIHNASLHAHAQSDTRTYGQRVVGITAKN